MRMAYEDGLMRMAPLSAPRGARSIPRARPASRSIFWACAHFFCGSPPAHQDLLRAFGLARAAAGEVPASSGTAELGGAGRAPAPSYVGELYWGPHFAPQGLSPRLMGVALMRR